MIHTMIANQIDVCAGDRDEQKETQKSFRDKTKKNDVELCAA